MPIPPEAQTSVLKRKPRVALLYSQSSSASTTGKDTAHFLGAALQLGGWSNVFLIPIDGAKGGNTSSSSSSSSSKSEEFEESHVIIVRSNSSRAEIADPEECAYKKWSAELAKNVNLFIVCVDPPDTEAVAKLLRKDVQKEAEVAVVSLQQGVMNFKFLKDNLENHTKIVLLDGAVGFSVGRYGGSGGQDAVRRRSRYPEGTLRCLHIGASVVVTRLSKEKAAEGVKFLNLLSTAGLEMKYRKIVTPCTWGVMVFNSVLASLALTTPLGGNFLGPSSSAAAAATLTTRQSLRAHLRCPYARLIWAAMLRECADVLREGSKRAKSEWAPENACMRWSLSFIWLERLLCLPTLFFIPLSWFILRVPADLAPTIVADIEEGRETNIKWTLAVLRDRAKEFRRPAPVLIKVVGMLEVKLRDKDDKKKSRKGSSGGGGSGGDGTLSTKALFEQVGSPRASQRALWKYLALRWGGFFLVAALWVLLLSPSLAF